MLKTKDILIALALSAGIALYFYSGSKDIAVEISNYDDNKLGEIENTIHNNQHQRVFVWKENK